VIYEKVSCTICGVFTSPETIKVTSGICRKCFRERDKNQIIARKNQNYLKLISWYQIATAIMIPLFIFLENGISEFNTSSIFTLWVGIVIMNLLAGFFLLKNQSLGIYLSTINLIFQSFYIITNSVNYEYHGIGGIFIFLNQNFDFGLTVELNSVIRIFITENTSIFQFGINPLIIFFLFIIYQSVKENQNTKLS
jgi:hypothetical protein